MVFLTEYTNIHVRTWDNPLAQLNGGGFVLTFEGVVRMNLVVVVTPYGLAALFWNYRQLAHLIVNLPQIFVKLPFTQY